MTIIQCLLVPALICCVYGQLNLQKRDFNAVAVSGLPEGHIYDLGEAAAHYDSIISSSTLPRLGSIRHGSESQRADHSYQKPSISVTDFSHNTGIGGYHWRRRHHKNRFRKSVGALQVLNRNLLDKRRDREYKVTLSPKKQTEEVPSSSERNQHAESSRKLSETKKYPSGRPSFDLETSTESSGGGLNLGTMKKFSSGRPTMNLETSPESSPSGSPRDHFFHGSPQLPRAEEFRDHHIQSHSM
ncbi:uncharacterized protein MELLADRAFT_102970 [Melampsora larici-populina 98AG31]|uniref:Secreted protein n=1 Tax=Melampsora larici-populina (strain 98AG31 / pathotype 3-4-7) TaxID=747676 RepID=F4RA42_MELLP|nr:uncharacterized protein MELLADRAFT_102970 [Melampsora larici-populina 98AG31]EGG10849.1 secreted protein [Melampsora larici-populina 98AG31]